MKPVGPIELQKQEADVPEDTRRPLTGLRTPLFLPVYEPGATDLTAAELPERFGVRGIMVNAYFLYRRRELRRTLPEEGLKDYLGFDGLVATDSGAFQAFRGRLYLRNRDIVRFQEDIGADVVSPLDVVTPPGDNRKTAEGKLSTTMQRISEALGLVQRATLMGVQQGGRFPELRRRAASGLVEMGVRYLALGSLVPFFTRNHNLEFVGRVIRDARDCAPPEVPIHLYGAGDPVELPFYVALGCEVFDSSSFVHYAGEGAYMTPYGALPAGRSVDNDQFTCSCPWCIRHGPEVRENLPLLCRHNLWSVMKAVERAGEAAREGRMEELLRDILETHSRWFPDSLLAETWNALAEEDDAVG